MLKSPKQQYQTNKQLVQKCTDMLADPDIQTAMHVALSQMCFSLPPTADPQASWKNATKIEGAKTFLECLYNLDSTKSETKQPSTALNYETPDKSTARS